MIDYIWTGMVCVLLVLSLMYALWEAEGQAHRQPDVALPPLERHPAELHGPDRGVSVHDIGHSLTSTFASCYEVGRDCRRRKEG